MENSKSIMESSPKNQSRIVLKELDNLGKASKSPNPAFGPTEQPEYNTKEPINLSKNQPETNDHSDCNKAVNRDILRVASSTDRQSTDDEFFDCNTTIKSDDVSTLNSSSDKSIMNRTGNVFEVIDASPNESKDETVCAPDKKLNLGFIETKTELGNFEAEKSTANDSKAGEVESTNQNCTVIINEPLACEEDISVRGSENLLSGDNKNTTVLVSASEPVIESEPTNELDTLSESKPIAEKQSEIIELPPATKSEPVIVLEPMAIPEISIESELVVKLDSGIETELLTGSEPAIDRDNGIDAVPVIIEKEALGEPFDASQTVIESVADNLVPEETKIDEVGSTSENPLKAEDVKLSNLNETCTVPSSPSIVARSQDSTFISTNNQIVVVAELASVSDSQEALVPEETKKDENPSQVEDVKLSNLNETCTVPSSPSIVTRQQDSTFVSINNQTVLVAELASVSDSQEALVPEETKKDENPSQVEDVKLSNLNETCILPDPPSIVARSQDSTFVSTNNQTVLVESESTKFDQKAQEITEPEELSGNIGLSQLQKIHKFKANESISADSLDIDSSLDSLQIKQPQQDDPSTPTDRCVPVTTPDRIFSSRKGPNFTEMFPNFNDAKNNSNNKPGNASFVIENIDLANEKSPNNPTVSHNLTVSLDTNDKVPLVSEGDNDSSLPDFRFKSPSVPIATAAKPNKQQNNINKSDTIVLNSSDFDYLQSRGSDSSDLEFEGRSSLLLRFDPLARPSILSTQSKPVKTIEETETVTNSTSIPSDASGQDITNGNQTKTCRLSSTNESSSNDVLVGVTNSMDTNGYTNNIRIESNGDKVISVDGVLLTNKKIDITLADENIRKKMEEYEATQEILLKRITEKDKAITKTSNVLELYEKAIAEALAAKEKLSQNYEKQQEELKSDRDVNFQHLLSLETTFADLHMKFERNVQYTEQLQEKADVVEQEKSKAEEALRMQEGKYDKMKAHAMQQFDIANEKYEQQTRAVSIETTKLKAQTKREEIHKNAVAEELSQKKIENEELVKICDELISGQRS